jgi:hypothetical protein
MCPQEKRYNGMCSRGPTRVALSFIDHTAKKSLANNTNALLFHLVIVFFEAAVLVQYAPSLFLFRNPKVETRNSEPETRNLNP